VAFRASLCCSRVGYRALLDDQIIRYLLNRRKQLDWMKVTEQQSKPSQAKPSGKKTEHMQANTLKGFDPKSTRSERRNE